MHCVRKVVTRTPHRRVGLIACAWFQSTPIEYESLLERDFVRIALLDLQISSISSQPFTLNLGEFGSYTPDFLLTSNEQGTVIEVKPAVFANNSKNSSRLKRAADLLAEKGYRFMVATEEYIRTDKRHERAGVLLRHARSHLPAELTTRVLTTACRFPDGIAIGVLAESVGTPASTILHLVGRRKLRISWSLLHDDAQLVFPIGGADGHLHT